MEQEPGAFEVGEELVAQADAQARPLEQAGDVRDDELAPVCRLDRPEDGRDRGERVVGDLRGRVRDPAEKGRLACVREPEEGGVG